MFGTLTMTEAQELQERFGEGADRCFRRIRFIRSSRQMAYFRLHTDLCELHSELHSHIMHLYQEQEEQEELDRKVEAFVPPF